MDDDVSDPINASLVALGLVVEARVEVLPRVRRAVTGWLEPLGLTDTDVGSVQVVVSELVANAVEATRPDDEISVGLAEQDRLVSVEVVNPSHRDSPVPIPAMADPFAARGRGLAIVDALAEEMTLAEVEGHTVARCVVRLGRTS